MMWSFHTLVYIDQKCILSYKETAEVTFFPCLTWKVCFCYKIFGSYNYSLCNTTFWNLNLPLQHFSYRVMLASFISFQWEYSVM